MQETGNIALAFPSNVFSLTSDDESSEQMNKSLAANANVTSQEEDDDSDGRQLLKQLFLGTVFETQMGKS